MRPLVRHPSILQTSSFTSFNGSLPKYPKLDKEVIFLGWKFLYIPNPNISNTTVIFRQKNQLWHFFFLMCFSHHHCSPAIFSLFKEKTTTTQKTAQLCCPFKNKDEIYFLSIRGFCSIYLGQNQNRVKDERRTEHTPFPPIFTLGRCRAAAKKRQLARCNQLMPSVWTSSIVH